MHEIRWRLDRLSNRMNREIELEAKLHGLEVKGSQKTKELSESDEEAMQRALEKAKLRKAAEYGRGR